MKPIGPTGARAAARPVSSSSGHCALSLPKSRPCDAGRGPGRRTTADMPCMSNSPQHHPAAAIFPGRRARGRAEAPPASPARYTRVAGSPAASRCRTRARCANGQARSGRCRRAASRRRADSRRPGAYERLRVPSQPSPPQRRTPELEGEKRGFGPLFAQQDWAKPDALCASNCTAALAPFVTRPRPLRTAWSLASARCRRRAIAAEIIVDSTRSCVHARTSAREHRPLVSDGDPRASPPFGAAFVDRAPMWIALIRYSGSAIGPAGLPLRSPGPEIVLVAVDDADHAVVAVRHHLLAAALAVTRYCLANRSAASPLAPANRSQEQAQLSSLYVAFHADSGVPAGADGAALTRL